MLRYACRRRNARRHSASAPCFAVTSKDKMATCKFGADDQSLKGKARNAFVKKCMSNKDEPRGQPMAAPGRRAPPPPPPCSIDFPAASPPPRVKNPPVSVPTTRVADFCDKGKRSMRMIAYLLAIICIIAAVMYFVMPAGSLPTFMPGYEAGSVHMHKARNHRRRRRGHPVPDRLADWPPALLSSSAPPAREPPHVAPRTLRCTRSSNARR